MAVWGWGLVQQSCPDVTTLSGGVAAPPLATVTTVNKNFKMLTECHMCCRLFEGRMQWVIRRCLPPTIFVICSSHSVLNHLGLEPGSRVRREIETRQVVSMNCSEAPQCWPDNTPVPSTLINCDQVTNQCICNDCFFRNDTGRCEEDSCEDYFFRDNECVDDRPSQLTAFLLSLFLSSTGAANFYIGQDGLGRSFYSK